MKQYFGQFKKEDSHKNLVYRIISSFIFIITILGFTPNEIIAQSSTWHDGSFTDSTGRTTLYRYYLKNDWSPNQPRGLLIYFHGNSTAAADEIRRWRPIDIDAALDLGLAVAFVTSPGSSRSREGGYWASSTLFGFDINSYGTRKWINQDQRLIHELLQSGFNSTLAVDYDQIVFMGVSQGTGFLTTFFEQYAGIYGGGFHAHCGPFQNGRKSIVEWRPSFQWTPFAASFVKSRFRVFVEATTEDFLHSDAVAMSKYYSESLGLETRWDLEAPGRHCYRGATPHKEVWEWLLSSAPFPKRPRDETDTDGDGIANAVDPDDDNDGALDFIDALPLDPRDWLDTDEDEIGNFADHDADGDGVDNALDPFPLDPREWLDTDKDGIGNTLDADDDNDGISDDIDASPLSGIRKDQLVFRMPENGIRKNILSTAFVHSGKPASVVYPEPQGDHQSYHFINLGDSANPRFQIMIDKFNINESGSCEEVILPDLCDPKKTRSPFLYFGESKSIFKIYIDRNQNQNLTDDGPPLILERNNDKSFFPPPGAKVVLEVPYASGDTFPYGIILSVWYEYPTEIVSYMGASSWMGYVEVPSGEQVLVGVVDANRDGIFNSKRPPDDFYKNSKYAESDFACIDLDRNDALNECTYAENWELVSPVYPGESFKLDGYQYTISVAPSGHQITWLPQQAIPQTLTKVSGDEQEGPASALLEMPLVVEVRDQNGNAFEGLAITFTITEGGGRLGGRFTVANATTDATGRARSMLTLGPNAGTNTVEVSIAGLDPVTFNAVGIRTPEIPIMGSNYQKWHLPDGAIVRLGKGAIGNSDRAVAFSPDGRYFAVASSIGIWFYDVATSRELALLPTEAPVNSVALSPDGRILASGSNDRTVKLWDVETRTNIATLEGHTEPVNSVSFSPDGKTLASGAGGWDTDGLVKLWDVETRTNIATLEGHTEPVNSVSFSPDGKTLASGAGGWDTDGLVKLWDVETKTNIATLEGHTEPVNSVSFSPDGKTLASGAGGWGTDGLVKLWDVETRTNIATLEGHTEPVNSVSFSPDGKTLASGAGGWGTDGLVKLWDVETRTNIATLEGHTEPVNSVSFSPDGKTLVLGSHDGTVKLWDVEMGNIAILSGHLQPLVSIAFSPNSTILASGSYDNTVKLWDVETRTNIATLEGHRGSELSVSFSPDGKTLASGANNSDNLIRLWDVETRTNIATLEHSSVRSVSFSPDGKTLASGSYDQTVKLWNVETRTNIATLEGHTEPVNSVSFSPDGKTLASGSNDRTVKLWNVKTRTNIATLEHSSVRSVLSVSFSPDGKTLASGSNDRTVKLWNVETRTNIATLEHRSSVLSVSFSPDGKILASGNYRQVTLWNVGMRTNIATLEGHQEFVSSIAFSPDGNTLVSGSKDGTIQLWDMSPYITPQTLASDFDGNGTVGISDFLLFVDQFGLSQGDAGYDARFDLDGNGIIGIADFLIFVEDFGKTVSSN